MSTVFIQVGQCGNQVGFQLWKLFQDEVSIRNNTVFSRSSERARCILVDSEPKVVEKPFAKSTHPLYNVLSPALVAKTSSGRGNNWATGYADKPEKDLSLSISVMELMRKEIEQCDYYKGCVLIHSLAGGTGSGLGCKLIEKIRDEYPICFITTASILPSETGDTPLQDYNSVLGLAHLQQYADAIIYYENDEVLRLVQQFSKRGSNVSTHNINECIAFSLCNLLVPQRNADVNITSIYQDLVPSESYKFIDTRAFPFVLDKQCTLQRDTPWSSLLESSIKNYSRPGEDLTHSTICATATFRGDDVRSEIDRHIKPVYNKVSSLFRSVPWADKDYLKLSVIQAKAMSQTYKIDRCISLTGNRTSIVHPIVKLISSAKAKFQAKAYLHWYQKYHCSEPHFIESFEIVDKIIKDYQSTLKINSN